MGYLATYMLPMICSPIIITNRSILSFRNKITTYTFTQQRTNTGQHWPAVAAIVFAKVYDPPGDALLVEHGDQVLQAVGHLETGYRICSSDPGHRYITYSTINQFTFYFPYKLAKYGFYQQPGGIKVVNRCFGRWHNKAVGFI